MNEVEIFRELGRIGAEVKTAHEERKEIKEELSELRAEVKEISDLLLQARGGWRTLLLVGGAFATLGGLIVGVLSLLWK